jgi:hypothetical protein
MNATMKSADFIRSGMKFFDQEGNCVKTCDSVNAAKKHSRDLQKSGKSVRRADSIGE